MKISNSIMKISNSIMKISIVIPCYNESKTIDVIINRIKASFKNDHEIIGIEDERFSRHQ